MKPTSVDASIDLVGRRTFVSAGLLGSAMLLSGCATIATNGGLDEALRRLLTISTQRAVTRLAADNGYLNDTLARVTMPESGTGGDRSGAILGALLRSRPVQDQLLRLVNDAAREAADRAAPVILDAIRNLSFTDAVGIVRGGPTAGSDYLERAIGPRYLSAWNVVRTIHEQCWNYFGVCCDRRCKSVLSSSRIYR